MSVTVKAKSINGIEHYGRQLEIEVEDLDLSSMTNDELEDVLYDTVDSDVLISVLERCGYTVEKDND